MRVILLSFLYLLLTFPLNAGTLKDSLPAPPVYLRCGDGKQGFGLYWIDKSVNENRFKIYRSVNSTQNYETYSEIKSKTGATKDTEYFCKIDYTPENYYSYCVTAANQTGESSPSNFAFIPKSPAGLVGKSDSISVTLDWNYPEDNWIQLVFVERSTDPDSGFKIMSPIVSMKGAKFIDYSTEPETNYYYRLRAAFYESKTKITCYTLPTGIVGPFRISAAERNYDGELNYQGRNYKIKTLGNQTWMMENLAYLPEVYPATSASEAEKRYYVYGYQGSSVNEAMKSDPYKLYGVLYNWSAASDGLLISPGDPIGVQGICPDGWHLPGNQEWMELGAYLDRSRSAKDSAIRADAKRRGVRGVQNIRFEGDFAMPDFSEFDAQPGGYLRSDSNKFSSIGMVENYWSSTHRILNSKGMNTAESDKGYGFPVRCVKGAALPTVSTDEITGITGNTAVTGGTVSRDGGDQVISRGVCMSTLENPSVTDNIIAGGAGTGKFSGQPDGLAAGTIYYIRTFATNSAGTAYGEQKQFITGGNGALPTVSTGAISAITGASAAIGGILSAYGGASVTARGICWNTQGKPTVDNDRVSAHSEKQNFTGYLPELKPRTTYYVRAFATNSFGTSYGEEKSFKTGEKEIEGTFDYHGRTYTYKTIGTQTWMTENLAYLPSVSPPTAESKEAPYYYVYGFEGSSVDSAKAGGYYKKYGVLYNWKAALTACPSGWHLPDDKEMVQLTDYLANYGYGFGGSGTDIAKSMADISGWDSLPIPGSIGFEQIRNNRSGFRALPAGQRTVPRNGMVSNIHKAATFWATTEFRQETSSAYALVVFYSHDVVHPYPNADKRNGYSVRCVKDKKNIKPLL